MGLLYFLSYIFVSRIFGEKLWELSDQVGSDAAEGVEKLDEELEESIDRALKDDRRQVPEQGEGDLQGA